MSDRIVSACQRFGIDEALLGDLVERRHAGASRWWFYRQLLFGVVVSTLSVIQRHRLLAGRSLAVGCVTIVGLELLLRPAGNEWNRDLGVWFGNTLLEADYIRPGGSSSTITCGNCRRSCCRAPVARWPLGWSDARTPHSGPRWCCCS